MRKRWESRKLLLDKVTALEGDVGRLTTLLERRDREHRIAVTERDLAERVPLTRCAWARVADRGPYTAAEWDLDSALASRIGFPYSVAYVNWRRAR